MRKSIIVALLLQATCAWALTPPATPGENVWDLLARVGQELDEDVETGISLVEVIESKVDNADTNLEAVASCCEYVQTSIVPEVISAIDDVLSAVEVTNSLVENIETIDLPRIESKVDNLASAINQSLLDDFTGTWTMLEALGSHTEVVESKVEVVDTEIIAIASVVEEINNSQLPVLESKIDAVDALVEQVASCCEEVTTVILPRIESKIDDIDAEVAYVTSVLDNEVVVTLPRIESKIDALDGDVSVVENVYNVVESKTLVVESKVDAFGGSISNTGPCDATPIKQADIDAAGGTLVIGSTTGFIAPGHYCLAEEIIGRIQIIINDVTLDLSNHTISNPGGLVLQLLAAQRIVVRNGRVNQGVIQMDFAVKDIVLEDLQVTGSGNNVVIAGASGGAVAERITMRRCAFYDGGTAIFIGGDRVSGVYIEDCTIDTMTNDGVVVQPSAFSIDTVVVKNCVIRNTGNQGVSANSAGNSVSDVQVLDSSITYCGNGVAIEQANKVLVKNCQLHNNVSVGIAAVSTNNLTVLNNTILGNGDHGMFVEGFNTSAVNTHIAYNSIRNNGNYGIWLIADNFNIDTGVIEYNTIVQNGRSGIYLFNNSSTQQVKNFSIEHNDLVRNNTSANANELNLRFEVPTGASLNTIVANKALTTSATSGSTSVGTNYSDQTVIPTIEWDRSAASLTVVSGGTAPTGWHNWSSIA